MRPAPLLASFLLTFPAAAPAQTPGAGPPDPVLDGLIREALEARPELRQARSLMQAAEERAPQVGRLPDPILTLGIQNDGFQSIQIGTMETSYWQVMVTQPLPWPGKRGFRADAAGLEAKGAGAALDRVRLTVEADVRRAYLDLLLSRDRLQLLATLEALWQQSEGLARIRYEVGEGPQSDLLRAQLERTRLRQRRSALEAEERARLQALNRLRSHPLDEPLATTLGLRDLADPPLLPLEEARADAEARSPELAAARFGRRASEAQLGAARRDRYPDFIVSAGVMPRGSLDPMWLLSVGITLPIYGRAVARRGGEPGPRARQHRRRGGRPPAPAAPRRGAADAARGAPLREPPLPGRAAGAVGGDGGEHDLAVPGRAGSPSRRSWRRSPGTSPTWTASSSRSPMRSGSPSRSARSASRRRGAAVGPSAAAASPGRGRWPRPEAAARPPRASRRSRAARPCRACRAGRSR